MDRDLYVDLGVSPTATPEELKAAWRAASAHHPDKARDEAERARMSETFCNAKRAYDFLIDPTRRAAYDLQRSAPGRSSAAFEEVWAAFDNMWQQTMGDLYPHLVQVRAGAKSGDWLSAVKGAVGFAFDLRAKVRATKGK